MMPSASMAKTAGVCVRSHYKLRIGSQDFTTMASFSREMLQLVPVLILLSLPSFLQDRNYRSRVSMWVGGGGQHLLNPSLWTDCCSSWEGKLGLFLPLASASPGLPGESKYSMSQGTACSFPSGNREQYLTVQVYLCQCWGFPPHSIQLGRTFSFVRESWIPPYSVAHPSETAYFLLLKWTVRAESEAETLASHTYVRR